MIVAAVMATSVLSGCTNTKTAVSIGDVKISTKIFNCLMENARYNIEQQNTEFKSNPDLWNTYKQNGKVMIDLIRDSAKTSTVQMAVYMKKIKEEKITLTDKEQKSLKTQVDSVIANMGGETAFNAYLKEIGIDRATYDEIQQNYALMNKLDTQTSKNIKVSDADVKAAFVKDYVGVKHILIKTIDANNKSLPQDKITAANAKAEAILKEIKSGANFDDEVVKYTEDKSGTTINKDVMVFTKNQMVQEFETAAFKLKVGEMSDVVRTEYGFHIIKRYDITTDPKYFTDNEAAVKKALVQDKLTAQFDKWKKSYKVDENDKYMDAYKFATKATTSASPSTSTTAAPSASAAPSTTASPSATPSSK